MLTKLDIQPHSISGVSVGGVYTSLHVPELDAMFDAGASPRSFVGAGHLFISHGHADHVGALPSVMGVRGLSKRPPPLTFLPAEIEKQIIEGVNAFGRGQRHHMDLPTRGVRPGDEFPLFGDLHVRVFKTFHSVPSVGYLLFRKVQKLLPEFRELPARQIAEKRKAGEAMFRQEERLELAYATDTLVDVLDRTPELYGAKTLILECTFLDDVKSREATRRSCHIHLDEILERADLFQNEHLVLMHFSQNYQPKAVHQILKDRLPAPLRDRVKVFAPQKGPWPG